MKRKTALSRLGALVLVLALLLTPARALTLDQARELLDQAYVDPIDQEILDLPTLDDILDALGDPYTQYLDPQMYDYFWSTMEDYAIGGIGITSRISEGVLAEGLSVDEVLEGTPAQKGGLQADDLIVEVDGVSLPGMDAQAAMNLIAGEAGTDVTLTYLRRGQRRTVTLTRAVITIPATSGQVLEGKVGYISCDTWGEDTVGYFRSLIEEMDDEVNCWLIDLRDNGGGLTDAAVDTAGLFCGQGLMSYFRTRGEGPGGYGYEFFESESGALTRKPVVLLVNERTASSSEVFAAALRDYGRAVIVGERTFGKGISQALFDQDSLPDYFPDGDCLKITYARVYSPGGTTDHIIGVLPHFPAEAQEAPQKALELAQALADAELWNWHSTADTLLARQVFSRAAFADTGDHPFEDAITRLAAYDLVRGKGDGDFHPEDTLTRAELAKMIQNVLDYYPGTGSEVFSDVPADAWYTLAVDAVADMGFMDGVGEDRFAPDRVLTRQELFAVAGRLARYLNDDFNFAALTMDDWQMELYAIKDYADWAKGPVWLLTRALEDGKGGLVNLLWEDPEFIDPNAPATRAEAAYVLYNLLSYLSVLP